MLAESESPFISNVIKEDLIQKPQPGWVGLAEIPAQADIHHVIRPFEYGAMDGNPFLWATRALLNESQTCTINQKEMVWLTGPFIGALNELLMCAWLFLDQFTSYLVSHTSAFIAFFSIKSAMLYSGGILFVVLAKQ